ncbi:MAG: hypothetical protein QME47_08220 [Candidatus Thermoplasmatota archaeon]|nr:hypothetical protein [Candidatus Thermoplasmatota archaeon]
MKPVPGAGSMVSAYFDDVSVKLSYVATITLKQGWNFITLPLYNLTYARAEDLVQSIDVCSWVGSWNSTIQEFELHKKWTDENNFTIDKDVGYFVYAEFDTNFQIISAAISTVTISLKPSWNSIGRFNSTTITARVLAASIGSNCTSIDYWSDELARFVSYLEGINNFDIIAGKGYFVHVISEVLYTNSKFFC